MSAFDLLRGPVPPSGYYHLTAVEVAEILAAEASLVAHREALADLHAEVEMAESVGICLPDRVPSLRAGALLAVDGVERHVAAALAALAVLEAEREQEQVGDDRLSAVDGDYRIVAQAYANVRAAMSVNIGDEVRYQDALSSLNRLRNLSLGFDPDNPEGVSEGSPDAFTVREVATGPSLTSSSAVSSVANNTGQDAGDDRSAVASDVASWRPIGDEKVVSDILRHYQSQRCLDNDPNCFKCLAVAAFNRLRQRLAVLEADLEEKCFAAREKGYEEGVAVWRPVWKGRAFAERRARLAAEASLVAHRERAENLLAREMWAADEAENESVAGTRSIDEFVQHVVTETPLLNACAGRSSWGDVTLDLHEPADVKGSWDALPFDSDSFGAVFADPPWDSGHKLEVSQYVREALRVAPVAYLMAPWLYCAAWCDITRVWFREFPGIHTPILLSRYERSRQLPLLHTDALLAMPASATRSSGAPRKPAGGEV